MIDLEGYKTATIERLQYDLADIVDYLDYYLEKIVNSKLDSYELDSFRLKGERIIAIADRLEELEKVADSEK